MKPTIYRLNGIFTYIYMLIIVVFFIYSCKETSEKTKSLDGNISALISTNGKKDLQYDLFFHGKTVIYPSRLGIVLNGDTLGKNVSFKLVDKQIIDETYFIRGVHNIAHNKSVQYTYEVRLAKTTWKLQTRLYNDGFAFRYLIPNKGNAVVNKELTTFSVQKNIPVWFFERPNDWKLKSYAGEWIQTCSDSLWKISPTGPVQGPALVYEISEKRHMAITEAALCNYSGMRLEAKEDASLNVNFTENEGFEIEGEIITPWRVMLLADDLNELVNSDIIKKLNPAPDTILFRDQNWIKPGRSTWSWWSGKKQKMTIPNEKQIIEIAGNLGFEYTLLDEGWEKFPDKWEQLSEICSYAKEQHVGVLVWKNSKQLSNPKNDYASMRCFLDSLNNAGVVGVKIDFMNGESKKIIDFDIRTLQLCAERHLMVDFHGCQKPSGESRTYPNELTREGIRGLELNLMKEGPITARHNAALPFTRFVLGDGDYTPLGFTNPGNTTWTHQLATLVCFTSSLQVIAEDPMFLYNSHKVKPVLDIIKSIPTVWDETIVLNGSKIGEVAAMARRTGNDWYVGILNTTEKKLDIDYSFIGDGQYEAEVVEDIQQRTDQSKMFSVSHLTITANTRSEYNLFENGGLVIKLIKQFN